MRVSFTDVGIRIIAEPDRAFMEKHGLSAEANEAKAPMQRLGSNIGSNPSRTDSRESASAVLSFNYLEMAACCGKHVEPKKAKEWLEIVVQRVGEAMRHCQRVGTGYCLLIVLCLRFLMMECVYAGGVQLGCRRCCMLQSSD